MAAYERQEVGLEEKRKHANSKAKKLKKSLQDVWFSVPHIRLAFLLTDPFVLQDEKARNDALRSVQENTAKVKSEKKKADQYEEELQREEKVLEGIRDSLKGIDLPILRQSRTHWSCR